MRENAQAHSVGESVRSELKIIGEYERRYKGIMFKVKFKNLVKTVFALAAYILTL